MKKGCELLYKMKLFCSARWWLVQLQYEQEAQLLLWNTRRLPVAKDVQI